MADDQNDMNWRDREDNSRKSSGYRSDYRNDRPGSGQLSQFSDEASDNDRPSQGGQMGEGQRNSYVRGHDQRGDYGRPRISRDDYDRNDQGNGSGRDRGDYGAQAMTGRDDARGSYSRTNAFGPSRFSDGSGGEFGSFNSQDYGGRDFQSNNRRTYSGADMQYSAGGYGSSYNDQSRGFDRGYGPDDRGQRSDQDDRGFFARAGDEMASWFGDDDASRRRDRDERRDGQEDDHRGRGPSGYTRSDERILEDACEALTHNRMVDASNIQVTVDQGEVTLDGTIDRRQAKRQAEDCVHDISGVKHVQNNLRIKDRDGGGRDAGASMTTGASDARATDMTANTDKTA